VAIGDEQLLSAAIGEAERVMGGFDRPHTGLLLVLPVAEVKGLRKVQPALPQETLPSIIQPDWILCRDTPIAEVLENLSLEPTVVRPNTPLDQVAYAMVLHANVHVVCVVEEESRLVGILDLRTLADDLFFHILPEEFLSEITDLEHLMEFAELSQIRTAGDAMSEPVWVKPEETVKEAFIRMHEHKLPGLPVVDERYRVVGYINLLNLLSSCLECLQRTEVEG
jgi:CBS domain-containing protein